MRLLAVEQGRQAHLLYPPLASPAICISWRPCTKKSAAACKGLKISNARFDQPRPMKRRPSQRVSMWAAPSHPPRSLTCQTRKDGALGMWPAVPDASMPVTWEGLRMPWPCGKCMVAGNEPLLWYCQGMRIATAVNSMGWARSPGVVRVLP